MNKPPEAREIVSSFVSFFLSAAPIGAGGSDLWRLRLFVGETGPSATYYNYVQLWCNFVQNKATMHKCVQFFRRYVQLSAAYRVGQKHSRLLRKWKFKSISTSSFCVAKSHILAILFLTQTVKEYKMILYSLYITQEADHGQLLAVVPLLPGTWHIKGRVPPQMRNLSKYMDENQSKRRRVHVCPE